MTRIVYIATASDFPKILLPGQFAHMRKRGLDVVVIASPGPDLEEIGRTEGVTAIGVPIEREMSPMRDIVAVWKLYRVLKRISPDIVNAGTPKAALVGLIAARWARVPTRVYTLHGLRLETTVGLKRFILGFAERVTSFCSDRVFCVSGSLRQKFVAGRFAPVEKTVVVGCGSANGVNVERFSKEAVGGDRAKELRVRLGIAEDAVVIGYLGRFTRDKGLIELVASFENLAGQIPKLVLLLVGRFEAGDALPKDCVDRIRRHPHIKVVDFVADTAPYYGVIDVLGLPSYREGFPTIVLEAAAAEVPAVGYRVTGVVDSIVDGETGTLVTCGEREELEAALRRYALEESVRREHGRAASQRVRALFRDVRVWDAIYSEYEQLKRGKQHCVVAPHGASESRGSRVREARDR